VASVLIIEDDRTLVDTLAYNLGKEGYTVVVAFDGLEGLRKLRSERPDLVLLDLMLPEVGGLEVCRIARQESSVPIIMLTAKADEVDKVLGLELGADDYITKPFSVRELMARIRAALRRANINEKQTQLEKLRLGPLEVDLPAKLVKKHGEPVALKPKEFELLAFLAANAGQVFSRQQLLTRVWGYNAPVSTRTVDVHVRWLREKLEDDPSHPRLIETVRGFGYRLARTA
jgi:DNA-binding response OmpR family regulator